jgi:hypothetical protein
MISSAPAIVTFACAKIWARERTRFVAGTGGRKKKLCCVGAKPILKILYIKNENYPYRGDSTEQRLVRAATEILTMVRAWPAPLAVSAAELETPITERTWRLLYIKKRENCLQLTSIKKKTSNHQ